MSMDKEGESVEIEDVAIFLEDVFLVLPFD